MPKFWSKILKQKKIVSFALLFFIVAGAILPNNALAFSFTEESFKCGIGIGAERGQELINKAVADSETPNQAFWKALFSGLNETTSKIGTWSPSECIRYALVLTIAQTGSGIVTIFEHILKSISSLFKVIVNKLIKDPTGRFAITRESQTTPPGGPTIAGSIFLEGWRATREWANILIVLGFIGVALAFILNLEQYKKLLVPLLIMAVLINFSVVFVGLIIDASNIVMQQFIGTSENLGNSVFTLNDAWNKTLYNFTVKDFTSAFQYLGLAIALSIVYLIMAITLFALGIIFVERYVILAILFILSPLAFVFYVLPFPQAKKLFSDWWQHFIKWCFVGLIGAFFLNFGSKLLDGLNNQQFLKIAEAQDPNTIGSVYGGLMFGFLIVIIFLIIGLKLTFKSAGWASGMVIAGATAAGLAVASGGAALLGKGALGTAKVAGRATGITGAAQRAGEGIKYYATRIGESRLLRPFTGLRRGAAALGREQQLQKQIDTSGSEKRMSALPSSDRIKMAEGFRYNRVLPIDPKKREETAGLVKTLVAKDEFKKLNPAKQEELARFMIEKAPGVVSISDLAKSSPNLAKLNKPAIQEQKRKLVGSINPRTGLPYHEDDMKQDVLGRPAKHAIQYADLQKDAERREVSKAFSNYKAPHVTDLNNADLVRLADQETAEGTKALEEAIKRGIVDEVKGGNLSQIGGRLNKASEDFGSDSITNAVKLDPRLKEYDTEAINQLAVKKSITTAMAKKQLVNEAYERQSVPDIKKMAVGAFNINFVKNTTAKRLEDAAKDLSSSRKNELKKLLGTGPSDPTGEINKAATIANLAGDTGKVKDLMDLYQIIDNL